VCSRRAGKVESLDTAGSASVRALSPRACAVGRGAWVGRYLEHDNLPLQPRDLVLARARVAEPLAQPLPLEALDRPQSGLELLAEAGEYFLDAVGFWSLSLRHRSLKIRGLSKKIAPWSRRSSSNLVVLRISVENAVFDFSVGFTAVDPQRLWSRGARPLDASRRVVREPQREKETATCDAHMAYRHKELQGASWATDSYTIIGTSQAYN
jgi:hypothetical protein